MRLSQVLAGMGSRPKARSAVAAGAALAVVAAGMARAGADRLPPPAAIVVGTVLEEQSDAPRCGDIAVAVWIRVRVDRVLAGRLRAGSQVRILVGCPGSTVVGRTYRLVVDDAPRAEHWGMYTLWGPLPRDALATFYWRSFREIR